jgi:uncharacterized protein (TIGR02301 family)
MTARRWSLLAGLVLVLAAEAALAQQQPQRARPVQRKKPTTETVAPAPKALLPPANAQEKPLLELSEAMGGLAFLTQICSPTTNPNPWLVRMEALVDSEGDNSGAREKMTGAYNHGFSDYSTTYRQCTDAARAARKVLTRDAARLARDLERRFGS